MESLLPRSVDCVSWSVGRSATAAVRSANPPTLDPPSPSVQLPRGRHKKCALGSIEQRGGMDGWMDGNGTIQRVRVVAISHGHGYLERGRVEQARAHSNDCFVPAFWCVSALGVMAITWLMSLSKNTSASIVLYVLYLYSLISHLFVFAILWSLYLKYWSFLATLPGGKLSHIPTFSRPSCSPFANLWWTLSCSN